MTSPGYIHIPPEPLIVESNWIRIPCNSCKGLGYTAKSATEYEIKEGKYKTLKQGSGCLQCFGLGYILKKIRHVESKPE